MQVLYLGKVKSVSHRKAPPTFIDEVLEKFRTHNRQEQLKIRQNSLPVRSNVNISKLLLQSSIDETSTNPQESRSSSSSRLVDTQEAKETNANNTLSILENTGVALQSLSNNIESEVMEFLCFSSDSLFHWFLCLSMSTWMTDELF